MRVRDSIACFGQQQHASRHQHLLVCNTSQPTTVAGFLGSGMHPSQFQLRLTHLRIEVHAPGATHVHHGRFNGVAGGQVGHTDAPATLVRCSQRVRGWGRRRVPSELVPCAGWGSAACMAA